MLPVDQISNLEQIASRAWPAKYTTEYGGWLLRATEGITRRANSVLPVKDPDTTDLDVALEYVQHFYADHKLPVRFQLTKASRPNDLDAFLDSAGLIIDMQVKVLTAPLTEIIIEEPEVGIVVFGSPWEDWFNAYQKFSGFDKPVIAVRGEIIHRISTEKACAAAIMDEKIVGIGLGVLDQDWLGLFSLVTQEEYRRQHVATSITQSLVSWGLARGAQQGYLQVETQNTPARQFYKEIGFQEAYSYWYRVQPEK
ncbi:MAG: GNAT family N-acetyltransferase [Candidatus Thorarchaeota archaeon]